MGQDAVRSARFPAGDAGYPAAESGSDLPCPACGLALAGTERFETDRVCPRCLRHFPLPARERLSLLVDPDSFVETNAALVSLDPLLFRDLLPVPDRLAEARQRADAAGPGGGLADAVVTGLGAVGGREAVLVVLDHAYLGGGIGPVAGEKIVLAMEFALHRRLPLVALCSAGGARTDAGMLSLVQLPKIAAAAAALHRAGVPFVGVLAHPTTGAVYAGLANHADVVLAEPGAQIGFAALGRGGGFEAGAGTNTAEHLLGLGLIDAVVERPRLRGTVATLLGLFADRGAAPPPAPSGAPAPPMAAPTPAWRAAELARHPERPTARAYLRCLMDEFVELHGDRLTADDPALVAGLGRLNGVPIAVVAHERGGGGAADRHPARIGPAGYRKAVRVMRLAGHLELPIVSLVDAAAATAATADGIGVAIGQAFGLLGLLPVPVVSVVVGEGGGAGALALGAADRMLMQEHAVYAVGGPESSPLPFPGFDPAEAGGTSLLTGHDCLRLGVVDAIVPEPAPAAHADPDAAARLLGAALSRALAELSGVGPRRLLDDRARKIRGLGQASAEGREAARREVRELQELQRTLYRSFGDLRERWDGLHRPRLHFPRPAGHLHRPDLAELAARFATRRDRAPAADSSAKHDP